MGFTIKFDASPSKVALSNIYIQIFSTNKGSWDFENKRWDLSLNLERGHSQTLEQIGSNGVTLADFSGGGRVYVSIGGPTASKMIKSGLQADIYNAKNWSNNYVFDKIEMGGDPDSIVNQTSVDFYSLPLHFKIDDRNGQSGGYINSRTAIMSEMDTAMTNSPWNELLIKDSTGKHTIGVLNPATGCQSFTKSFGENSTILDQMIKDVLPKNSVLYVGSEKISGKKVQTFKTDNNRNVTSIDGGDTANIAADCFTTFSVFCNAPMNSKPSNTGKYNLFGAISAQILRGLSFLKNDPVYFSNFTSFPYTNDPYAKVLHDVKNAQDGKSYAMGYDDTGAGDFSSSIKRPAGVDLLLHCAIVKI